jgi:hypothetical protein
MLSAELNRLLIQNFPYLREKYLKEVSWQEGHKTGSHVVYADVLRPHLTDCISHNRTSKLERVFNFLEDVLSLEDEYAEEVILFSIFENTAYLFKEKTICYPTWVKDANGF